MASKRGGTRERSGKAVRGAFGEGRRGRGARGGGWGCGDEKSGAEPAVEGLQRVGRRRAVESAIGAADGGISWRLCAAAAAAQGH